MTTRLLLPLLALAVTAAGCGFTIRQTFISVPSADSLHVTPVDADAYEQRYGPQDGVYLLNQTDVRTYGSRAYIESSVVRRLRYVVLNPNVESLTTASYEFDPDEKLTEFYSIVTSPDGRSRIYTRDDLVSEETKPGVTRYRLAYPDVQRGTIIEEVFQTDRGQNNPPRDYSRTLQYRMPADTVRMSFSYPDWWQVQIKRTSPDGPNLFEMPTIDDDGDDVTIEYEAHHVPQLPDEPFSPYYREFSPYFEMMFSRFNYQQSRFEASATWEELGKEYGRRYLNSDRPYREEIEKVTRRIVGDRTDKREAAQAILTWLQDSIEVRRYGEHYGLSYVFDFPHATIPQVAQLSMLMMKAAGIPTRMYLVHSAEDGFFDSTYITGAQMSMLTCEAEIDGKSYPYVPFWRNVPLGYLPWRFQNQEALQFDVDEHDEFSFTRRTTLNDESLVPDASTETTSVTISESGDVAVDERHSITGSSAIEWRDKLETLNDEDTRKEMEDFIGASEGDLTLETYEVANQHDCSKPLEITLHYRANNAVTLTPEEVVFHTAGLLAPPSESHWKLDTGARRSPIVIYGDKRFQKDISITYPAAWRLSTKPRDRSVKNQFGEIASTFTDRPGRFEDEQRMVIRRSRAGVDRIGELRQLVSATADASVPSLVFERGAAATDDGASTDVGVQTDGGEE